MLAPGRQQGSRQVSEEEPAGTSKRGFQPYHSRSVPKSENLEAQATRCAGSGTPVRTMMLRNIPNKYVQTSLLEEIDSLGFLGTYDFFYLPMDVHNRSNVGYAFINFVLPADAERFRKVFSDHRFQRFQSRKVSSVCSAHVQGLDENLRHFENRAVTHARNDQYRPIVLSGNQRVDFEEAVAGAKLRAANTKKTAPSPPLRATMEPSDVPFAPWSGCAKADLPQPSLLPATGIVGGARQGLEEAIRSLLSTVQVGSPGGAVPPPPGLGAKSAPQANSADANASDKTENDIEQLLSLRNLLVERLVEKENQAQRPAGQGRAGFMHVPGPGPEVEAKCVAQAWEEPSYVSPSKLSAFHSVADVSLAHEEWCRPTPRTNVFHPKSSLHQFTPAEPWARF
uniref:Mei2-like C-terminal RNA recognition motif domain-containing protein n=1 Tax=Alexandrium monilatum TaxID=311494 RepID=A0A7S4SWG8_9DINO